MYNELGSGDRAVAGLTRYVPIPNDPARIGQNLLLQFLVRDPGASHGLAYSRGLRLTIGE